MPLIPGTRIGAYEILGSLGAGGMGEVYRATDLDLKRAVAIKVLPDALASGSERLARFQREAEVLASLNHPHIAAIYGLERSGSTTALVMELVDGPTLAERIVRGSIPVDEALAIARQIAEALEAAHEHGVVHRDLKPANIKVRDDGTVKVLDFGLAKIVEASGAGRVDRAGGVSWDEAGTMSPTITSPAMTGSGLILGTAAYMSPEQARGKTVDRRADIWAFGCVLFELLTGKQAFEGDTVSDRFASILRAEPAWNSLPPLPASVRLLLQQCLRKDARRRLQHIGDARVVLEEHADSDDVPASVAPPRGAAIWRTLSIVMMVLLTAALALAGWQYFRKPPGEPRVTRFLLSPPEGGGFESGIGGAENWPFPALSPDGLHLAFTARDGARGVMLWVRAFDSATPRALTGTEGAGAPFWSPDSRSIAFFAKGKLKRVDISGGPVRDVCDVTVVARGGAWNRDGVMLFSSANNGPLYRVASSGGAPVAATDLTDGHTSHRAPLFLPDGRHFLFFAVGRADVSGLYLGTLDSTASRRLQVMTDSGVGYSISGHLLFTRQGILFYQPFDPRTFEVRGEPTPIAEQIAYFANLPAFSVSEKGDLAFWSNTAEPDGQLTWIDRAGRVLETIGEPGTYRGVDLSAEGKLLVHRHDASGGDIFVVESSAAPMRRLTFDASQHNSSPVWSADGSDFVFQSLRGGKWGIYQRRPAGAADEKRILESDVNTVPVAWSADKKSILFWWLRTGSSLWRVDAAGKTEPSLVGPASSGAQYSPDGKWLLYSSVGGGASEVYLEPIGSPQRKLQVSPNGGIFPRWRRDGNELFYITTLDRKLVAVTVEWLGSGSDVRIGGPVALFDVGASAATGHSGGPFHFYAVSPDGQRFLLSRPITPHAERLSPPITVIQNWAASLDE